MAATINADNGVVSGSSGVKTTADTSGVLALQSNGSTALSISTGLVTTLTNPLPVGSGGTGITTTPTAGAVPYGNGTTLAYTAAGTSGQVLTSAGSSAPTWTTLSGAQTLTINSNTTLSAGSQYLVDTSLNTVTVTLPASPSTGNTVAIYDANYMFGNNNLTINPNGSTLAFRSGNLVVSTPGRNLFLRYNGTTWVSAAIPGSNFPQVNAQATTYSITGAVTVQTGMGFGDGLFVGLTWNTYAATSPDGITWTQRSLPSSANWSSVAYGNGRFVAVAGYTSFSSATAYSDDGITWTAVTGNTGKWVSIAYGGGVFCAANFANSTVQTSTDGTSWTSRSVTFIKNWEQVLYGNGRFVLRENGTGGTTTFSTSTDGGVTWSANSVTMTTNAMSFGNGRFVCIGYNTNAAYVSLDGYYWVTYTNVLPGSRAYERIVFCNNTFYAFIGSSTIYAYSSDGMTWAEGTLPNAAGYAVAVGNGVIANLNSTSSIGNQIRVI
jgi:hypothetical protein